MCKSRRVKKGFEAAEEYETCQSWEMTESDGRKGDYIAGICFFEWITPFETGMRVPGIYLSDG